MRLLNHAGLKLICVNKVAPKLSEIVGWIVFVKLSNLTIQHNFNNHSILRLTAPNHYLNQSWPLNTGCFGSHVRSISYEVLNISIREMILKNELAKSFLRTSGTNELTNQYKSEMHITGMGCIMILQIAKFMGPTWGQSGSWRPQIGSMWAPWTFLSGPCSNIYNFRTKERDPSGSRLRFIYFNCNY